MDTFSKKFIIEDGVLSRQLDNFLEKTGLIEKSANTKASEFKILIKTFSQYNHYSLHSFSLNELEATITVDSSTILSLALRDTNSDKKVVLTKKGAEFIYVKGKDMVGEASDLYINIVKEPIFYLIINGVNFSAPVDMETIYTTLTGEYVELWTEEDIQQERFESNMWDELSAQIKEELDNV